MKLPIKLLTAVLAVALNSGLCLAQNDNNVITHTVARGETLSSIAKLYSVTEVAIIELNPDAAQFVYVGMDLKIPSGASPAAESSLAGGNERKSVNPLTGGAAVKSLVERYSDADSDDFNKWEFSFSGMYGIVPKPDGASSSHTFSIALGVDYRFDKNFYVGGKLGYRGYSVDGESVDFDTHAIALPLELGYRLGSDKIAVIPYAGIEFDYIVSSKFNDESVKMKSSDKFCVGGRVGAWISLWGFRIGAAYEFPINDNFGDESYPEVGIGFGF